MTEQEKQEIEYKEAARWRDNIAASLRATDSAITSYESAPYKEAATDLIEALKAQRRVLTSLHSFASKLVSDAQKGGAGR